MAPSVEVGGGAGHAVAVAGPGGTLAGTALGGGGTVSTVAVGSVGAAVLLVAVADSLGGSSTVALSVLVVISVVVHSPLVIVSAELASIALVGVRLSGDAVVGLAPSGVVVGAISLLGPLIVVVRALSSLLGAGGTLPGHGAVATSTLTGSGIRLLAVAEFLTALPSGGSTATLSLVLVVVGGGSSLAVGGSAVNVAVLAPSLSAPLVIISVVPLIVRLGGIRLSEGLVVRDILSVVLVSAPGIPVGGGLAPVLVAIASRGTVVLGLLATGAVVAAGATLAVLAPPGGGVAVSIGVTGVVPVVILGPLVIIGADLTSVVLVGVALGLNGVVRLAPSGVVVGSVSLLGPGIVVVGTLGGTVGTRGTLPGRALSTLSVLSGSGLGVTLALALLSTGSSGATGVSLGSVVLGGGGLAVGGGSVDITVLAPGLGTPLVVVLVVPLVVGLGGVGFGVGAAVGLLDAEVLVSAISIPVGGGSALVVSTVGLGGTALGAALALLDRDLELGLAGGVGVAVADRLDVDGAADSDERSSESEGFHVGRKK